MAEFKEVMRQAHRLCSAVELCDQCPLEKADEVCYFDIIGDAHIKNVEKYCEEFESVVMQWAAEHPEPQYPSWEEWQKENFPNAGILICHGCFGKCLKKGNPNITCEYCRKKPIPADIAERLGIKPKLKDK